MITIIPVSIIILSVFSAGVIVVKNVPTVAFLPEEEIYGLSKQEPLWTKFFNFISAKQKIVTSAILTKTIRRLKVISLKADNIATKLLIRIQSESNGSGEKDHETDLA